MRSRYVQKIKELREVAALVYGLAEVARGFGSGFGSPATITLPRAGLPSIKGASESDFVIRAQDRSEVFKQLAQSLRLDPRANHRVPMPK